MSPLLPQRLAICCWTFEASLPQIVLRSAGFFSVLHNVSGTVSVLRRQGVSYLTAASKQAGGVAITLAEQNMDARKIVDFMATIFKECVVVIRKVWTGTSQEAKACKDSCKQKS